MMVPPASSKRLLAASTNFWGEIPAFRAPARNSTPWWEDSKPTRDLGQEDCTDPSSSAWLTMPCLTSGRNSSQLTFHSWSRPWTTPRSTMHTAKPWFWRARATRIPKVPPQTTTSNNSEAMGTLRPPQFNLFTTSGTGSKVSPRLCCKARVRSRFQTASARAMPSKETFPPLPGALDPPVSTVSRKDWSLGDRSTVGLTFVVGKAGKAFRTFRRCFPATKPTARQATGHLPRSALPLWLKNVRFRRFNTVLTSRNLALRFLASTSGYSG